MTSEVYVIEIVKGNSKSVCLYATLMTGIDTQRDMNLQQIEESIVTVESQINNLKQEGEFKTGYWFDTAKNSKGTLYTRLCWHDGGKKKRRVLSNPNELSRWRGEVSRGDKITALDRELSDLKSHQQAIENRVEKLTGVRKAR